MATRSDFDRVGRQVATLRELIAEQWRRIQRMPNGSERTRAVDEMNLNKRRLSSYEKDLERIRTELKTQPPLSPDGKPLGGTSDEIARKILAASFPMPFDISKYIDETVRMGQGAEYLYSLVLKSPEFAARFGYLRRADGTLRMSPSEAMQLEDSFAATAAQYGISLSQDMVGRLIAQGMTPSRFETRAQAIRTVKQNPTYISAINQAIGAYNAQYGTAYRTLGTFEDAVGFFANESEQDLYDIFEAAQFSEIAKKEGFDLTPYRSLEIARDTEGILSVQEARDIFARIRADVDEAGVEIRDFGLTPDDLLTVEARGRGSGTLAVQLGQAVKQRRAQLAAVPYASQVQRNQAGRLTTGQMQEVGL